VPSLDFLTSPVIFIFLAVIFYILHAFFVREPFLFVRAEPLKCLRLLSPNTPAYPPVRFQIQRRPVLLRTPSEALRQLHLSWKCPLAVFLFSDVAFFFQSFLTKHALPRVALEGFFLLSTLERSHYILLFRFFFKISFPRRFLYLFPDILLVSFRSKRPPFFRSIICPLLKTY